MIRYLLLLLFFIMFVGGPLGLHESVVPGLSIKNALLYILFAALAIETTVTRNRKLEVPLVLVPFGLLFAYCFLSYLTVVFVVDYPNYDAVENGMRLKTLLLDDILMLLVFFYGALKVKDAIWLIRMAVWLVMLGNIVTLADVFKLPDLEILELGYQDRIQGFVGQPNEFGGFLALFLPATLGVFLSEIGVRRIVAGIGVLATFLCLLLTFSRGAFVGVVLGALFASVFLRELISVRTAITTAIIAILACVVAVPLLFAVGYGDLLLERLDLGRGSAYEVTQGRSSLWLTALSVMMENPITFVTGYGWNAYYNFRDLRLSMHNTYLNDLFNLGLIGLVLHLTVLFGVFVELRRRIVSASAFARSYLVLAIFGIAGLYVSMNFSDVFYVGVLMWAYIGLVLRVAMASQIGGSNDGRQLESPGDSGRSPIERAEEPIAPRAR